MTRVGSLRDVVEKSTGTRNPAVQPDDEFTYVDVSAIDNQQKIINGARLLLGSEAPSRARKLLRANDVLVSTVRPNLNAVALVPSELDGQVGSTGFCVLRAMPSRALPEYLFYFARSQRFVDALAGLVAGALYPAVTDSQVLDQGLPLPSLDEQRRIVDLLSRAEGIVRLRRQAQQKAAELIPAIFVDMFGEPARNPKAWPERPVAELCTVGTGATPRREVRSYYEGGTVPWVKTGEVSVGAIHQAEECITELAVSETNCKVFPAGTILIAMYGQGQTRGRAGMLKIPAATNQACAAILPSEKVNQSFLFEMLRMQYERLRAMGRGGNQANLNLGMIKTLRVPVPPLDVQRAFARHAEAAQSIQVQQALALQKAAATFNALLTRTFAADGVAAAVYETEEAVS